MPLSLIEEFETFYIGLPRSVRDDLSFMMVILSNEDLIFSDPAEVYAIAAQSLFRATTRIGRVSRLIGAVSILDVYFAMDVQERFAGSKGGASASHHYSKEIDAILAAKQRWQELRATRLTAAAISKELSPSALLSAPSARSVRRSAHQAIEA